MRTSSTASNSSPPLGLATTGLRWTLILLALLLLLPSITLAETADAILHRHSNALGSARKLEQISTMRYSGALTHDEFTRKFTWTTLAPGFFREDTSGGGVSETLVTDDKSAWARVFNGVVFGLQGPDRDMAHILGLIMTRAYLSPEDIGLELGNPVLDEVKGWYTIPVRGRGFPTHTLSFDRKNWLLTQVATQEDRGSFILELGQYRKEGGIRFPGKVISTVTRDGIENRTTYTIEQIERNPELAADLFEREGTPKAAFTFKAGAQRVEAPLKYVQQTRHIFVEAALNGHAPTWFFLDSGAGATVLDQSVLEALKLPTIERTLVSGVAGSQMMALHPLETIAIGDLEVRDTVVTSTDLSQLASVFGFPIGGILGMDVFHRGVVELDYQEGKVTFIAPETFKDSGAGEALPIDRLGRVSALLSGRALVAATVDTGSGSALDIPSVLAEKEGILPPQGKRLPVTLGGVGGTTRAFQGVLEFVQVGQVSIPMVLATFHSSDKGMMAGPNGVVTLGNHLLERFTVTFNLPGQQVLLTPNKTLKRPFRYNRSGLRYHQAKEGLVVDEVTAIAKTQLRPGDIILALKNDRTWLKDLAAIEALFYGPTDTVLQLKVKRGRKKLNTTLTLTELL